MNRRRFVVSLAAAALALCLPAAMGGSSLATAAAPASTRDVCGWDIPWADLTAAEKSDWLRLDWTPEMWDANDDNAYPETENLKFSELTADQRSAVVELGFNQDSWDNIDKYCGSGD